MTAKNNLKLLADSWYSWQMIPGYGGERCVPYCSPISVKGVQPPKTGKREIHWGAQIRVPLPGRYPGYLAMSPPVRPAARGCS
jgi:hypothetical protein